MSFPQFLSIHMLNWYSVLRSIEYCTLSALYTNSYEQCYEFKTVHELLHSASRWLPIAITPWIVYMRRSLRKSKIPSRIVTEICSSRGFPIRPQVAPNAMSRGMIQLSQRRLVNDRLGNSFLLFYYHCCSSTRFILRGRSRSLLKQKSGRTP